MQMQSTEAIIEKIASETGKTEEEINKLVSEKKQKFSGLLTEEGAAFMIAREFNIDLDSSESTAKKTTVSELKNGMQGIELELTIQHVFSPKDFEKNGKKGKLCSLLVGDETGETRLTAWNEDIKKLEKIEKGDKIIAKNCYVKSFQDKPQISLSFKGDIILKKKGKDKQLAKISDLGEEMQDVSIKGKITNNYGLKTFPKQEGEGKITSFELEDETGSIRTAAWDETAEKAAELKTGEKIKIEGAYTKQGQNGLELHLGWRARIIKI